MSKKGFPGKGLSNTQTCSSKGSYAPPVNQSGGSASLPRARTETPKGARFPGKSLSNTQTQNHPPIKR